MIDREIKDPAESASFQNREVIAYGVGSICEVLKKNGSSAEGNVDIQIIDQSGEKMNMNLKIGISLENEAPFITISISAGGQDVAARIMVLGWDKQVINPKVMVTGRVDTYKYLGLGLGSGLLESSELVAKKALELSNLPKDSEITMHIYDGTNNPLHPKYGWTGKWARRLGYEVDKENQNYYSKVLT